MATTTLRRICKRVLLLPASLLLVAQSTPVGAAPGVLGINDAFGPDYAPSPGVAVQSRQRGRPRNESAQRLRYWNEIAIDAGALDHTPVGPDEKRVFGEQLGPARTSRALAIVHIALFEAVNAIGGTYRSYTGLPPAPAGTSLDVAIAQAAHDGLVALYPSQADTFHRLLDDDLKALPISAPARAKGVELGHAAAKSILSLRAKDGSDHREPRLGVDFFPSDQPGFWRQDPISRNPLALGARWPQVRPFVVTSASQFRAVSPPPLTSSSYSAAFDEVKAFGGDGSGTPTKRSPEQTEIGIFWAYDGTPALGTPPRLYNQIAVQIAEERKTNVFALARLLALLNVAMADGAINGWETKYIYQFWRPVTGIRESDPGTGPTGAGDGNPATMGDPGFTPLGAPASNLLGPNFTPPFPAYTSGHATFGGALFQVLRKFYGTDRIGFQFQSDEFNGVTKDNRGNVRPRRLRSFAALSQAEEENGQSRIYLGIHWSFDKVFGIKQGRRVANFVFTNAFQRVRVTALDPADPPDDGTTDLPGTDSDTL
jgi:hypothetical protein